MPPSSIPMLLALSVAFLIGIFSGVLSAPDVCEGGSAHDYLSGYVSALTSGADGASFALIFLNLSLFHLASFLCGFSALGVFVIPALALLRGFSLSFTLAVFTRLYSLNGALAAYFLFGAAALVSVPLFFTIAVQSMCASFEMARGIFTRSASPNPRIYTRAYFIRFLATIVILSLLAVAERYIMYSGIIDLPVSL